MGRFPRRFHEHTMEIKTFFIDKFPVTNAQFKQFLDAAHYAPATQSTFCATGKMAAFPKAGIIAPSHGLS